MQLIDVLYRWVNLFNTPDTAKVLAPIYRQEFYFWLLRQPESGILFHLAKKGTISGKIRNAINIIRRDFNKNISMKELCATVSLSHSGFHKYFRQMTGLTPLQFQKQLRLQEARRLMLRGSDASIAGYNVGYESTSQFSREYRRYFGYPPKKDIARLRET
ncbi:helix-turn-helix domain-containing protein [Escherichia coli]|nr:helix-turn-helix domain-containing protein [Escherichia coli]